jgi:Zn-dependent peptidase ImmA (M78 family)
MQFIIDKVNSLNIGWNERPLFLADIYRLCKRFKIVVQEMPLTTGGFYYRVMGRDFIAIDSRLAEPDKLFVLFHELGHYLLHTPESGATANFHKVGSRTRKECEADVFALCALMPLPMIKTRSVQELIDDGLSPETVSARFEVLRRYGF